MKTIKVIKESNGIYLEQEIGGVKFPTKWRAYLVDSLPKNFGCIEFETETEGISEWFNYKGLTYVREN